MKGVPSGHHLSWGPAAVAQGKMDSGTKKQEAGMWKSWTLKEVQAPRGLCKKSYH